MNGGVPQARLLQFRVGAFILVALGVFVGLVYLLGRQSGLFERQYRLVAAFAQIGGLVEGATVRLAGVPVGRVTAIRLPASASERVQVELRVSRRVRHLIRADSVARIETLGLLGDKIVEVTLGSPGAPELAEGARLRAEDPLDTARLTQQGTELLRNLVEVSADLKTALGRISESAAGPHLAEAVRAVRALLTEVEQGRGALHRLIYDERLGRAVADAATTLRQLGAAAQRLDALLASPRVGGLLDEATAALGEARETARRAGRVLEEWERGRLGEEVRWTLVRTREVLGRVEALLAGAEAAGLAGELRGAAAATREAMAAVERVLGGAEAAALLGELRGAAAAARGALGRVDALLAGAEAAGLAGELRGAAAATRGAMAAVERVLGGAEAAALLGELRGAAAAGREAMTRAARLLSDEAGGQAVAELQAAAGAARRAMERIDRIARQVEEGGGLLHALVYEDARTIRELDQLLTRAGSLLATVERGEGALGVLLRDAEAARALRRLVAAADGLARGLERARDADGLLQALLLDPAGKAVVADLRETARHFRELTARAARGEGLLGALVTPGGEGALAQAAEGLASLGRLAADPRLGEALADLRSAMANLRAITERVESGEGTLGGLVADPTVYENLAAFLEGAQRSLILRALIRAAIGRAAAAPEGRGPGER